MMFFISLIVCFILFIRYILIRYDSKYPDNMVKYNSIPPFWLYYVKLFIYDYNYLDSPYSIWCDRFIIDKKTKDDYYKLFGLRNYYNDNSIPFILFHIQYHKLLSTIMNCGMMYKKRFLTDLNISQSQILGNNNYGLNCQMDVRFINRENMELETFIFSRGISKHVAKSNTSFQTKFKSFSKEILNNNTDQKFQCFEYQIRELSKLLGNYDFIFSKFKSKLKQDMIQLWIICSVINISENFMNYPVSFSVRFYQLPELNSNCYFSYEKSNNFRLKYFQVQNLEKTIVYCDGYLSEK